MTSEPETPTAFTVPLFAVRVLTVASMFLIGAHLFHVAHLRGPCFGNPSEWSFVLLAALAPLARVLWRLRPAPSQSLEAVSTAVAFASAWGGVAFLLTLLIWRMTSWRVPRMFPLPIHYGTCVAFGFAQAALAVTAFGCFLAIRPPSGRWRGLFRGTLEAGIWIVVLSLVMVIAVPHLERNRLGTNTASAIGQMRAMGTAQVTYADTYPQNGYAATLADLGPSPDGEPASQRGANLIMGRLAVGEMNGYRFTLIPGARDSAGRIRSYTITARPLQFGTTGCINFFTDESARVRWTREDRPATVSDLTLDSE